MSRITSQLLELAKNGVTPEAIKEASAAVQAQQDREAQQQLQEALRDLQAKLPTINQNEQLERNGQVIATFASYEAIMSAIQPLLTEHGFTVMFHTDYVGANVGSVACIVSHVGGASVQSSFPLMVTDWSDMSEVQAIASGETFAKRRALCSAFNIVTKGADKNGELPVTQIRADVSARPEGFDKTWKMLQRAAAGGQKAFSKAWKDTPQNLRDWAVANELDKVNTLKKQAVTPKDHSHEQSR